MKTLIVGLTGQTGAGKSTVAAKLAEKGFFVIDGDVVAREVMQAGAPLLKTLANEFGADIIKDDDSLNRRLLASRAFANRDSTARLNAITHPAITENIKRKAAEAEERGESVIVIDAAVLLESGVANLCDIIAVVTAPEEIRLNRIMERDNLSKAEAIKRIGAQLGDDYYNNHADIVLNAYPQAIVEEEVQKLIVLIYKTITQ